VLTSTTKVPTHSAYAAAFRHAAAKTHRLATPQQRPLQQLRCCRGCGISAGLTSTTKVPYLTHFTLAMPLTLSECSAIQSFSCSRPCRAHTCGTQQRNNTTGQYTMSARDTHSSATAAYRPSPAICMLCICMTRHSLLQLLQALRGTRQWQTAAVQQCIMSAYNVSVSARDRQQRNSNISALASHLYVVYLRDSP
jgi:hypothetical protein